MRESQIFRVRKDRVGAPRGIEHDLGFLELGHVVVEVAHLERRRCHETVAAGFVSCFDPANIKQNDFRLFGLWSKSGNDGVQRTHP